MFEHERNKKSSKYPLENMDLVQSYHAEFRDCRGSVEEMALKILLER